MGKINDLINALAVIMVKITNRQEHEAMAVIDEHLDIALLHAYADGHDEQPDETLVKVQLDLLYLKTMLTALQQEPGVQSLKQLWERAIAKFEQANKATLHYDLIEKKERISRL